ncbi:2-C-methyl-D-erythritol 4-phosphate cytidylyltransferase [Rubritalea halochordaticola]|uniref:2-C-methyl-D-erythritol 4-phosphate cytidylyltransferase n=1 Tax=Rubritalea halochordaticola TaxID=714537 RepID=A0ABP9UUU4_9BACT
MSTAAIIVAAGTSRRMGFDKLLAPLDGEPVLKHSIKAFARTPEICEIIVVCPEDRFNQLDLSGLSIPVSRVNGGSDRHNSVYNGIKALTSDAQLISVHDGARPLISPQQIEKTIIAASQFGAATSAKRIVDTVKRSDDQGVVVAAVDRDNLWAMETPQIFKRELLQKAYEAVESSGSLVTDEVSALELIDVATHLVENNTPNIKITFPQDIQLAEKLRS